jgi:hypothetical protein
MPTTVLRAQGNTLWTWKVTRRPPHESMGHPRAFRQGALGRVCTSTHAGHHLPLTFYWRATAAWESNDEREHLYEWRATGWTRRPAWTCDLGVGPQNLLRTWLGIADGLSFRATLLDLCRGPAVRPWSVVPPPPALTHTVDRSRRGWIRADVATSATSQTRCQLLRPQRFRGTCGHESHRAFDAPLPHP